MMNPIIEKKFEYFGFPCVVMFMPWGCHRCGYVGLPHKPTYIGDIECHGGITYCNSELFGQKGKDFLWIGFDCAHAGDERDTETGKKYFANDPKELDRIERLAEIDRKFYTGGQVRTLEFCISECMKIVDQVRK